MSLEESTENTLIDAGYAQKYRRHHRTSVGNLARTALERRALRRALKIAGYPQSVLDIPSGLGRFWPTLGRYCQGELLAADIDPSMLEAATTEQAENLSRRFTLFTTSVLDMDMRDDRVDTIVCMRLMHHLSRPVDRIRALREMARVGRRTVIVSLWTDRSLSSWWQEPKSRRNMIARHPAYGRRVCVPARLFEWEAREAGLEVIDHVDVLPCVMKWRLYILGVPQA